MASSVAAVVVTYDGLPWIERCLETAGAWKRKTLIDHSHEAILETTAFFESLADWSKIRSGLLATPLVGSVQVFALSPRGAELRLRVFGDPSRLGVAMENYGVTFWSEDGERWFLATPNRANQLKGSRWLQRRRAFFDGGQSGRQDPPAPRLEAASQPVETNVAPKIETTD